MLTRDEAAAFAIECYRRTSQNGQILMSEFREDFARFVYINRIVRYYIDGTNFNIRLMLNYIIITYNVFGNNITPIFFLFTKEQEERNVIYTVLKYMSRIPDNGILNINNEIFDVSDCDIVPDVLSLIEDDVNA